MVVRVCRGALHGSARGQIPGEGNSTLELGTREPTDIGVAPQVPLRVLARLLKVKAGAPEPGQWGGAQEGGLGARPCAWAPGRSTQKERHKEHAQSKEDGLLLPESLRAPG